MRTGLPLLLSAAILSGSGSGLYAVDGSAPALSFAQVAQFVESHGWRANLGPMCGQFSVPAECRMKQISFNDDRDQGILHGFNVSESMPGFVIMFRAAPERGTFFVANSAGTLISAHTRSFGTGYIRLPAEKAAMAFAGEVQYWTSNFSRISADVAAQKERANSATKGRP